MLKLQLNHDALERLIGDDSEAQIEIRNSIAQEFGRKHLKAIANSDGFQHFLKTEAATLRSQTEKLIEQYIGRYSGSGSGRKFELAGPIREQLTEAFKRESQAQIDDFLANSRGQFAAKTKEYFADYLPQLDRMIQLKLEQLSSEHIDSRIKTRLKQLLENAGL